MINYAIKRTTDGLFWNDSDMIWSAWDETLDGECEYGTPEAVADAWVYHTNEGTYCQIVRVRQGIPVT